MCCDGLGYQLMYYNQRRLRRTPVRSVQYAAGRFFLLLIHKNLVDKRTSLCHLYPDAIQAILQLPGRSPLNNAPGLGIRKYIGRHMRSTNAIRLFGYLS